MSMKASVSSSSKSLKHGIFPATILHDEIVERGELDQIPPTDADSFELWQDIRVKLRSADAGIAITISDRYKPRSEPRSPDPAIGPEMVVHVRRAPNGTRWTTTQPLEIVELFNWGPISNAGGRIF
jgi:hypothetical protein